MPESNNSGADRNLLFGVLAWQNGMISEAQLLDAMKAWTFSKERPLGSILVQQQALEHAACQQLEKMVDLHIALHHENAKDSLASLRSAAPALNSLAALGDPDIQRSLGHFDPEDETDPRLASTVGVSTSEGTRFRILRPHARGGLGEVFVARDVELNREVALKEIQGRHANNHDTRNRFRMEAEITGQLEHPGIVPVYGLGAHPDGRAFYAMRFIQGESLMDAIKRYHNTDLPESDRRLEFRELLKHFVDVCDAIEYAHSRSVLHRDLKPSNIMLGRFGETLVVDWGLSRALGVKDNLSPDSSLLGTEDPHWLILYRGEWRELPWHFDGPLGVTRDLVRQWWGTPESPDGTD
jgi:serine/threonine-protein kinase